MKIFNIVYMVIFLTSLFIFGSCKIKAEIIIRQAEISDFDKIMQLDRDVSFEYFKNLYQAYYSSYDFGKNPDYYLEKEIVELDSVSFLDYINNNDLKYCILIAMDTTINNVVGILLLHKEEIFV